MKTVEDTLTEDLVAYWGANRPAGLPEGWPIYHAKHNGERTVPCVVIGDDGGERVSGMDDTRMVNLMVMPVSSPDSVEREVHRAVAGAMDEALRVLLALTRGFDAEGNAVSAVQPLANCHLHELLAQEPVEGHDAETREDFTELKRVAVVSRYRAE